MTPEERAEYAIEHGCDKDGLIVTISSAIRAAVAEEREACARVADEKASSKAECLASYIAGVEQAGGRMGDKDFDRFFNGTMAESKRAAEEIAAAIRARG